MFIPIAPAIPAYVDLFLMCLKYNFIRMCVFLDCPPETWGPNCQRECDCSGHGQCDPNSGHCICATGKTPSLS